MRNCFAYSFPTAMLILLGVIWFAILVVSGMAEILERQNHARNRKRQIRD